MQNQNSNNNNNMDMCVYMFIINSYVPGAFQPNLVNILLITSCHWGAVTESLPCMQWSQARIFSKEFLPKTRRESRAEP